MYIGRFQRNQDSNPSALMLTDIGFQRLDEQTYQQELQKHYKLEKEKTGADYFAN